MNLTNVSSIQQSTTNGTSSTTNSEQMADVNVNTNSSFSSPQMSQSSTVSSSSSSTHVMPDLLITRLLPRKPALSTSKLPSNSNIKQTNQPQTNQPPQSESNSYRYVKKPALSMDKPNHFKSSDSLFQPNTKSNKQQQQDVSFGNQPKSAFIPTNKSGFFNHSNNQSSINTSSISSFQTSSSTSGFVSGTSSVSNSIFSTGSTKSSSSSSSSAQPHQNTTNHLDDNSSINLFNNSKNDDVLASKRRPIAFSSSSTKDFRLRLSSFQPTCSSTNAQQHHMQQPGILTNSTNKLQRIDSSQYLMNPLSSSTRHTSTTSATVNNQRVKTPRASTNSTLFAKELLQQQPQQQQQQPQFQPKSAKSNKYQVDFLNDAKRRLSYNLTRTNKSSSSHNHLLNSSNPFIQQIRITTNPLSNRLDMFGKGQEDEELDDDDDDDEEEVFLDVNQNEDLLYDEDEDLFVDEAEGQQVAVDVSNKFNQALSSNKLNSSTSNGNPQANLLPNGYHNSMSTASCIANEINYLNKQIINGNVDCCSSSASVTSSSASLSPSSPSPSANMPSSVHMSTGTANQTNLNNRSLTLISQTQAKSNRLNMTMSTSSGSATQSPTLIKLDHLTVQPQAQQANVNLHSKTTHLVQHQSALSAANMLSQQSQMRMSQSGTLRSSVNTVNGSQTIRLTNNNNNNNELPNELSKQPHPPPLPSTQSRLLGTMKHSFTIMSSLRNFSHFDVQSAFFNYEYIRTLVNSLHTKSVNVKTGASAAAFKQINLETLTNNQHLVEQPRSPPSVLTQGNHAALSTHRKPSISSVLGSLETNQLLRESTAIVGDLTNPTDSLQHRDQMRLSLLYTQPTHAASCELSPTVKLQLVEECPCFRLELGGDVFKGLGLVENVSQRRMMKMNSISILDKFATHYKRELIELIEANNHEPFMIEYQDWGAYFYRFFFANYEHSNYLGMDADLGPVVISVRRDKLLVDSLPMPRANSNSMHSSSNHNANQEKNYEFVYRFIMRTSDLTTLRGTILEEHILSKSTPSSKGLPHKEVISFLMPDLDITAFHSADSKCIDKLIELDEQYIIKNHKVGILLCKAGQSTEEEMYNNKETTPAFDEFLQLIGKKVRLKGFNSYRGGLDNVNDTTGTHSLHAKFRDKEIMFHVSTLLPYSNNDRQQLTRKRHIGNDLVTIVFQEPGSLPFSPKSVRSQYQHIFIVVRVINPNTCNTQYSVAVSYSNDVPSFGPPLPKNPLFVKSKEFREFLLAKIINADNVGLKCEKFNQIRMRTRNGILKELVENYSTKFNLEQSSNYNVVQKLGLFNFGSIKHKKVRSKSTQMFKPSTLTLTNTDHESMAMGLFKLNGAIFWCIESIEDSQYMLNSNCFLGISRQYVIVIDAKQRSTIFSIACHAVIGWTLSEPNNMFTLYFDHGEYVIVRFKSKLELLTVIKRLEYFTKGCRTIELCLEKKDYGVLGFNIHHDGVVTEVEPFSLAYYRGLKQGTRIVKIGEHFVINLDHEDMIDLLRRPNCLKITFLMPLEDGSARRGQDDSFSLYAYLSTCSSMNERLIDSINQFNFQSMNASNQHKPLSTRPLAFSASSPPLPPATAAAAAAITSSQTTESPVRNRRLTNNSNIIKLINRLSTTCSNMNLSNEQENFDGVSNSLYGLNHQVPKSPSRHERFNYPNGTQSSSYSLRKMSNTMSNSEWSNLVQTASKAFENAHRYSEGAYLAQTFQYPLPLAHSNTNSPENVRLSNADQQTDANKAIPYEELKDKFIELQLELSKEKLEKRKFSTKIANILEENKHLKEELSKVKSEYKQTLNRSQQYLNNLDLESHH